jgi:hypothetical protein
LGLKFLKEGSELKAIKHLKASCALDEGYEPARKLLEEILTENEGKNNNTNKKEQRNGEKR